MLETALLEDGQGKPLLSGKLNDSREWSAVNAFCNRTYMPLSTRPLTRGMDPNATMRMLKIGRITSVGSALEPRQGPMISIPPPATSLSSTRCVGQCATRYWATMPSTAGPETAMWSIAAGPTIGT